MRHKQLLLSLIEKMMAMKQNKMSSYDILQHNVSDEIQELAQAYGETLAMKACLKSLDKLKQGKQVMKTHYLLFGWDILLRESTFFLLEQWMSPDVVKALKLEYNNLIKAAASEIDHINESLNIPVHAIYSPIAKNYVLYNEKPYEGEVLNAKM